MQAGGLEGETGAAAELGGDAAFDQPGAEAALLRLADRRPALLHPIDVQQRTTLAVVMHQLPTDFDAAAGNRQRNSTPRKQ